MPEFEVQRGDKTLLGVGVRQKRLGIISVNVYAVAAYVPLPAFKHSGAHINGNIEKSITVDKDFVIRMARHVDSAVLGNALKDALQPHVSAASLPSVDMLQVFPLSLICM
jgi:hypothetical protein